MKSIKPTEVGTPAQRRARAYPPIAEQLDALFHAINRDPELRSKLAGFIEPIAKVKADIPKE